MVFNRFYVNDVSEAFCSSHYVSGAIAEEIFGSSHRSHCGLLVKSIVKSCWDFIFGISFDILCISSSGRNNFPPRNKTLELMIFGLNWKKNNICVLIYESNNFDFLNRNCFCKKFIAKIKLKLRFWKSRRTTIYARRQNLQLFKYVDWVIVTIFIYWKSVDLYIRIHTEIYIIKCCGPSNRT